MKWSNLRKWSRNLHRDLSFLFAGMILIYAISGIALNHRRTFNANYSISVKEYPLDAAQLPNIEKVKKEDVIRFLQQFGEQENYTKHYMPHPETLKVFLKGGSNIVVDYQARKVTYEQLTKRPVLSALTHLHYNVQKWWIIFSDIFAVALIIITLTGMLMMKGKKGIWGVGGIELIIGIIIPLIFIFFV